MSPLEALTRACAETRGLILVVTGAGVSLASGIPTFRGNDPDAVWHNDVFKLGTIEYFRRHPAASWQWYLSRFEAALAARPNPAHFALAALERWQKERGGRFLLVTQNVDVLHEHAGSRELVKVHGSLDRVRCSRVGCDLGAPSGTLARSAVDLETFQANPVPHLLPHCPACGALVRQHVLWFDEYYEDHRDYQYPRVLQSSYDASMVVFVGTSFAVGVTDMVMEAALERDVPVFSVDPAGLRPHPRVHVVAAPAEEALVEVCHQLGAPVQHLHNEEPQAHLRAVARA